ncbi:MAG: hypothetical protein ABI443_05225 [Chthoniobacterales bacterium]
MLRVLHGLPKWLRTLFSVIGLVLMLALAWACRMASAPEIFIGGNVYYFDPDCYSRMTRVKMVLEHPFKHIAYHAFENYPQGVFTHTTAPLDYAIALLTLPMRWLSAQPVDMAGAFIGPLLGLLSILYLWWWCRAMKLHYLWMLLFVAAVSPILAHGYAVGRPDHQNIILLFLTVALTSEWTLWQKPSRGWAIVNGCAWGLALWTSFFEPLILLVATLLLRGGLLYLPQRLFKKSKLTTIQSVWLENIAVLGIVLFVSLLFEGIRIPHLSKETLTYFDNWSHTIAELRPMTMDRFGVVRFTGWLLYAAPFLLVIDAIRSKSRESLALAVLVILTAGLTIWEQRWGYFVAMMFAISLPWVMRPFEARWLQYGALIVVGILTLWAKIWVGVALLLIAVIVARFLGKIRGRWIGYVVFIFSLGPMAWEWQNVIYPPDNYAQFLAEKHKDAVLLHEVAEHLISPEKTPILAPWWLSPAITYWSGQPSVSGSSHESLPGTVDSARFYLATNNAEAREILNRRGVRYVVAYEPERIIDTSAKLLGKPAPENPLGALLYQSPEKAPRFLQLVYANEFFKVYENISLNASETKEEK